MRFDWLTHIFYCMPACPGHGNTRINMVIVSHLKTIAKFRSTLTGFIWGGAGMESFWSKLLYSRMPTVTFNIKTYHWYLTIIYVYISLDSYLQIWKQLENIEKYWSRPCAFLIVQTGYCTVLRHRNCCLGRVQHPGILRVSLECWMTKRSRQSRSKTTSISENFGKVFLWFCSVFSKLSLNLCLVFTYNCSDIGRKYCFLSKMP